MTGHFRDRAAPSPRRRRASRRSNSTDVEAQGETCVLCLRRDGGAVGQEHVLQAFLGGRWKLPPGVICDRCNAATSLLDNDLKRYLSVVVRKQRHSSVLAGGAAIVQVDGRWWGTRVRDPDFDRCLPPQLVIPHDVDEPALAWAETLAEFETLRREFGAPFNATLLAPEEFRPALAEQDIVVRSGRGKYTLLCDPSCADEFLARLGHRSSAIPVNGRGPRRRLTGRERRDPRVSPRVRAPPTPRWTALSPVRID